MNLTSFLFQCNCKNNHQQISSANKMIEFPVPVPLCCGFSFWNEKNRSKNLFAPTMMTMTIESCSLKTLITMINDTTFNVNDSTANIVEKLNLVEIFNDTDSRIYSSARANFSIKYLQVRRITNFSQLFLFSIWLHEMDFLSWIYMMKSISDRKRVRRFLMAFYTHAINKTEVNRTSEVNGFDCEWCLQKLKLKWQQIRFMINC